MGASTIRAAGTRFILVLALTTGCAAAAHAADPVFPPASRIGLVPPPGFVPSKAFSGFQHGQKQGSILFAELPGYAFESIEKEVANELQKEHPANAPPVSRQDIEVQGGRGFIVFGRPDGPQGPVWKWTMVANTSDVTAVVTAMIPDAVKEEVAPGNAIPDAFKTLAVRTVPNEEQQSVLPFSLGDLAGFRILRVQPGGAAMLTDGPKDAVESAEQALVVIAMAPGPPPQPPERDSFARRIFSVPGVKDIHILRAEPMRLSGYPGHEILMEGKDAKSNADVTAVQWLRFGTGGVLQVIGLAKKDAWPTVFPRLRTVRDGIEPK